MLSSVASRDLLMMVMMMISIKLLYDILLSYIIISKKLQCYTFFIYILYSCTAFSISNRM